MSRIADLSNILLSAQLCTAISRLGSPLLALLLSLVTFSSISSS